MNNDLSSLEKLLGKLSPTIHEPVRLGILMLLHLHSSLTFTTIQKALGVTSGNLNTHLTRLEVEGFVKKTKAFVKLRPQTIIMITKKGRLELINYSCLLKQVFIHIEGIDYQGNKGIS